MRTALITTTIFVPKVLAVYRAFGNDVRFFVAGDEKTSPAAYEFVASLGNCETYGVTRQKQLGYKASELIGWNCIQRRNIALLEALKWGADVIYTIDDDNIPIGDSTAVDYCLSGQATYRGLKVSSPTGWFDSGSLLTPPIRQRGYPVGLKSENVFEPIVDAKIGVATGLILGDADMDAHTRIACAPLAYSVNELARAGVVTDPKQTWTPFNTQNTAFLRELAPAMFCAPGLGRHDDIFASLITQRIMRERDLFVHVGQPFVYQQRNQHNLLKDLSEEVFGMKNILGFAEFLDACILTGRSDMENLRLIWKALGEPGMLSAKTSECALAFLDDCESVL